MTLGQFRQLTKDMPDSIDMMIEQTDPEFTITSAESAEIKEVKFSDGKLKATDKCLVISDRN